MFVYPIVYLPIGQVKVLQGESLIRHVLLVSVLFVLYNEDKHAKSTTSKNIEFEFLYNRIHLDLIHLV